jgi:hypothetical protein
MRYWWVEKGGEKKKQKNLSWEQRTFDPLISSTREYENRSGTSLWTVQITQTNS